MNSSATIGIYDTDPEAIKAMTQRYIDQCQDAEVEAITELFATLTETQRANLVMQGQCQAFQIALRIMASQGVYPSKGKK